MACHYDAASGELTPTEARPTVPGAPVGVQGQTFPAAIRISGGAERAANAVRLRAVRAGSIGTVTPGLRGSGAEGLCSRRGRPCNLRFLRYLLHQLDH